MAIEQGLLEESAVDGVSTSVVNRRTTRQGEGLVKSRSIEDLLTEQNTLLTKILFVLSTGLDVPDGIEE